MDIEKVAEETPELILKETIEPSVGLRPFQTRKIAFGLGIPSELINKASAFMTSLYEAYEKLDASLVEINPFLL
ncbi:succinate--CoA ligase subunit beta, partial [Escherichia coli]|nr:succinate--CoA ligase subunit beta [Escherichia coli]